jgi:hypothetical protein
MSNRLSSLSLPNLDAEGGPLWDDVVRLTFEAHLHHQEGRSRIAERMLREELPAAIRSWSCSCQSTAIACKQSLRAMFTRVREQVAMASVQRRMILADISAEGSIHPFRAIPSSQADSRAGSDGKICLRQRIPIDDVSAMLDAVAESQSDWASDHTPRDFKGPPVSISIQSTTSASNLRYP